MIVMYSPNQGHNAGLCDGRDCESVAMLQVIFPCVETFRICDNALCFVEIAGEIKQGIRAGELF